MKTRTITLALVAVAMFATGALARFVVLDVNFDGRTAGDQLGRGGALQGEPVNGPWDRHDEVIVAESASDMAVEFPDAQIIGPSEMYFALRDGMTLIDGKLTARWTVNALSQDTYEIALRSGDLLAGEFCRLIFDDAGHMYWTDSNNVVNTFFAFYVAGLPTSFMVEVDIDAGTYTLYRNGAAVVTDEPHGVTGHDLGSLVFSHPDDGDATGALVIDDIELDWRPGTAAYLLEANFSDKPVGEVIGTRGAFYGEPVYLGFAEPYVEVGPPLGTKALVFEDTHDLVNQSARFEFLGGVEPHNQPVSISFAMQTDQFEDFSIYVREQGGGSEAFLSIKLYATSLVLFSDAASGGTPFERHLYTPGESIKVEMHFEPVLGLYSVWWNDRRVIHRRAHGIVDRDVGSLLFGTSDDADLDGTLYVDRIRVQTLGAPLSVDNAPIPVAPAIRLGAAPNPFNPATEIRFELPAAAPVTLDIFDGRGRLVRRLVDETLPAGQHRPVWRGLDQRGQRVASGVYHAKITAGGVSTSTAMTLVK